MSIDPKFVELTADVLEIFLLNAFESLIHIWKNVHARCGSVLHRWFLVGYSPPFMMRLAEHPTAAHALGARDACLVGENPTCSVPA